MNKKKLVHAICCISREVYKDNVFNKCFVNNTLKWEWMYRSEIVPAEIDTK